jgi:excisionase family DNA binding protein
LQGDQLNYNTASPTGDRLLTAHDVAELLSVPVSWVREYTRRGLIPHITLGHYRRYRLEAIREWVAAGGVR